MNETLEIANGVEEIEEAVATADTPKNLLQKIKDMRACGEVGSPEFIKHMRELEVLLGVSQVSPFGTNELEIFEENLASMSYTDMQRLAQKVGINHMQDRSLLKRSLLKEFGNQTKNSRRNIMPTAVNSFVPDPDNPKHQKLIKILGDI